MGKKGKSTKHRKTREFLAAGGVAGRGRGPSLLRRGEKRRTAMPRPGGPWPDCLSKGCRPNRRPRKNPQWIKPNWQKWRTEKHQNCAQTLPNVTSETYRKGWFQLLFPPVFPPAAAVPAPATPSVQKGIFKRQSPKIEPLPAANPHGSEGRKSMKIAPKHSLM